MEKIDILSLTPEVLGQHLAEMGEPKFRAKQLFHGFTRSRSRNSTK